MKIKANFIKPGMVITILEGSDKHPSTHLVLAIEEKTDVHIEYRYYSTTIEHTGQLIRTVAIDTLVKVLKGTKRQSALDLIQSDCYDRRYTIENDITLVEMVISLDAQHENESPKDR